MTISASSGIAIDELFIPNMVTELRFRVPAVTGLLPASCR
jgi:hypothetical protein